MSKIVNVGLVGFGMAGTVFHGPLLNSNPKFYLKKVLERKNSKSRQKYPHVEVTDSLESILNDSTIDLVVIGTPNFTHFDFAKKSLEADKHVIVDKPFTATSYQAQELIDLSKSKDKVLSVFQNRRWDGDFKTVKKVVESGWLGDLLEYEAHYDRYKPALRENSWKEVGNNGTGVLYDLGSHLIDQALVLFGMPESVTADIRSQRPKSEIDDNFELILNYGKLKVSLKSSLLVREVGPHFILNGISGSFIKYGMDPQEQALNEGITPLSSNWGIDSEANWGFLNSDNYGLHYLGKIETLRGSYHDYYENIYNAIVCGEELAVKPEEAKNTIKIIELANRSNAEKRTIFLKE